MTTDRSSRIQVSPVLHWVRERATSMTISGSHASASDETSRPEAPLSPGSAHDGLSSDGLLYDAFISYSRHDLDAAAKIENEPNMPIVTAIVSKRTTTAPQCRS